MHQAYIERVVNLLDNQANILLNCTTAEAIQKLATGNAKAVREIDGQFALVHVEGKTVRMARSIGRPMRYFLAKQVDGPCLVIAERIDQIAGWLKSQGYENQFHPSYTRMVPAHHITTLNLLGCPDPNPTYDRFFAPQRNKLSTNLDEVGTAYIGALAQEVDHWLDQISDNEPLGVLFSGGVDSGSVFLVLYHRLMRCGLSPARLKAFTLAVDGGGKDLAQARQFLKSLNLELFLEPIEVASNSLDFNKAIRVIEDYKPLDVQSATMALALCEGIRARYPDWKYLLDGDGGDENLKDYPIEDNKELTIRSVLHNLMLYQEGWGVDAVKHSLTYSGGQSRGHVRTSAPARALGFSGLSPYALPNVIEVAEGIPFIELTDWNHQKLYSLKGEIVRRGVKLITGLEMPIFEKRRFQHGAAEDAAFTQIFPKDERAYRRVLDEVFA
jgi:asparagine synthase (glutamine-hydrolysing)